MASYVDDSLIPGERIIKRAEISRVIYAGSAVWFLGCLPLLAVKIANPGWEGLMDGYEYPVLFGIGAVMAVYIHFRILCTELAVTNKRIMTRSGIVRSVSEDLDLTALESVFLDQDALGRLMDYGSLTFLGTGNACLKVGFVKKPLEFRKAVMERADAVRDWAQAPRSGRSSHGSPFGAGHLEKIR